MKLWLLRPLDENSGPWNPWYDKAFGFVIHADSEARARELANANGGDETYYQKTTWLDPNLASCIELSADGEAGVVIRDFHSA